MRPEAMHDKAYENLADEGRSTMGHKRDVPFCVARIIVGPRGRGFPCPGERSRDTDRFSSSGKAGNGFDDARK
jgi:hypothetical protein